MTYGYNYRTPVICADPSSVPALKLFDRNLWPDESKAIIQSCGSEYSAIHFCVSQINAMCVNADRICAKNIETLQQQWNIAKFDSSNLIFFAQQPYLHILIEAFFSGVKTLLDLLMQLLTTEKIVQTNIDGFHRDRGVYGGRVLNAINNNAVKEKKSIAIKVNDLILDTKKLWIDDLIYARDLMIHPLKGMDQLMFHLELVEKDNALVCKRINFPEIKSIPIHIYSRNTLNQMAAFSENFMKLLQK